MTSREKPNKHAHIRDKIRASKILQRLEADALGELDPPMTAQQIRSAEITLKKVIPDLQSITLGGDEKNPIVQKLLVTGVPRNGDN